MKIRKFKGMQMWFFNVCLVVILVSLASSICWGDDAMILPKDRWMINEVFHYYPSWDKQFNNQGDSESLANDYNRDLDSRVFHALESLDSFLPVPASLGRSIVDFEKKASITNFLISHALTENITIGFKIPYWTFKNKVKTSLDNTYANTVKNPDPNTMALMPIIPITAVDPNYAIPGYSNPAVELLKLTREEIISLLSEGLDINGDGTTEIAGYGYERFETWSDKGIGDIEFGLKYQYLKNEKWRLSLQAGSRLPTGRHDDPDNLVDYGFGSGNYDIMLGFQNDYLGFKNLILNGTIRYTNQLPDKETLRVPADPDYPITQEKQKVNRDQGDTLELEVSASYKLPRGFTINTNYGGFFKEKDTAKGEDGQRLPGLEGETSQTGHTLLFGISYNNLDRFQKKLARVPFQFSLNHWHRFAGKNLNKAQYFSLKTALFF